MTKEYNIFHKNWLFYLSMLLNVVEGLLAGTLLMLIFSAIYAVLNHTLSSGVLLKTSLLVAGVFVLRIILYSLGYTLGHIGGAFTIRDMRLYLGEKLKKLPLINFGKINSGNYLNVITTHINNYENILTHKTGDIVKNITLLTVLLLFMLWINPVTGLINIAAMLWIVPCILLSFYAVKKYGAVKYEALAESVTDMLEYVSGIQTFRAYGLGGDKNRKVNASLRKISDMDYKYEARIIPLGSLFSILSGLNMPVTIILAGWLWLGGGLSGFYMVVLVFLALQCRKLGDTLFVDLTIYKHFILSKENIAAFACEAEEPHTENLFTPLCFDLEFRDVCFNYNPAEPVLKNVSFIIPQGCLTAIVGDSGAGKSTILSLLAKYYEPASGSITIGGINISNVNSEKVLAYISLLDQNVFLFNDTIKNNIGLNTNADEAAIIKAGINANCHQFITSLPQGYDTFTGENGNLFSGGERQRISIARAFLKQTPIVLLDEATSSLDIENELAVKEAIQNLLKEDKTVVMVAHNLSVVRQAAQIIVMQNGTVVESGTHDELLQRQGKYWQMWQAEASDRYHDMN